MPAAIGPRLRRGGLGFLVLGLAVNDAGDALLGILAHPFPDAHHVAARGVHDDATLGFDLVARGDFGAERRDDHRIAGLQQFQFFIRRLVRNDLDAGLRI